MIRLFIGFLVLLFFPLNLLGQKAKPEAASFSYAMADVSYSSDAVFMGRRDSIEAPYLLPSVGYYDKSGFFANAAASYLVKTGQERFDLFLLSAGYIYTKDPFSAGLSATKYFFNEDSYNVQSEIEADVTGLLSYDFKVAELSLMASAYFGSGSTDVMTNLLLDRTFYALNNKLLISPALVLGAGTQNFYEEYYNYNRMGNRKGGGNNQQGNGPGGPGMMQETGMNVQIAEASEFNLLNIEVRLPLQLFYKSFIFSFTPAIAFPQTPSTITTADGVYKEDLDSVFYWSAGISYWLKTSK